MSDTLDIEKAAYRQVKSGMEYDHLFPKPDLNNTIINRIGNVKQTVREMQKIVAQTLNDTKLIAPKLFSHDLRTLCKNVWEFVYWHYQYKLDKQGEEQLRTPARAWHDRFTGVDCDCYSITISSILTNLNVSHTLRVTKYLQKDGTIGDWQHVYVIVPYTGSHYTLDCVAHHFDYEKSYYDKTDYNMTQLNGIPIAILSGFGDTSNDDDLYGILTGIDFAEVEELEGLGKIAPQEKELSAIYNHLVRTRNYIIQNPTSVIGTGGSNAHLQMLNYAIDNWHTPQRDKALELLEKEESRWNIHNGVSGVIDDNDDELSGYDDDSDEISGLGAAKGKKIFWSKIKTATKKVGTATKKVGQGIKNTTKALVRFNPVTMAVRGGFLLAMKVNMLKIAEKILPGYWSQQEAKSKGIDAATWEKSKNGLKKIEHIFVNVLQGKTDKLKKAITSGRAGKELNGLGALGEPATIATIITAVTPLIAAYAAIKQAGLVSKQDEQENGNEIGYLDLDNDLSGYLDLDGLNGRKDKKKKAGSGEAEPSENVKKGFIAMIRRWWRKKFGKEDAVAPETVADEDSEGSEKEENTEQTKSGSSKTNSSSTSNTPAVQDSSSTSEVQTSDSSNEESGWGKFAPVAIGVGLAGIVVVGALIYANKKTSPPPQYATGIAGTPARKRKSKRKKGLPSKMKTVILR